ncbi:MAG: hypothetical protein AAFX94_07370 [Myxococcota bacterium]
MVDPLIIPSIAMLTGGGILAARDYLKRRLHSSEDRYMSMYGKTEWDASNMDLTIHFDAEHDEKVKAHFFSQLARGLREDPDTFHLLTETADVSGETLKFVADPDVSVEELMQPRRGMYFDADRPGEIRMVWNHMQTDGVGMWTTLRTLFDENPPLIPYKDVPIPPPVLPELLAIPSTARRLAWRGKLKKKLQTGPSLQRGLVIWDADSIRTLNGHLGGGSFNILACAIAIHEVFQWHPDRKKLTVGLTAYFPFLEGRNKYGVILCKIRRGSLADIVRRLQRQTKNPIVGWGTASAQSYALGRMPDRAFVRLISYYRKQVDVLVSSLPVGQKPITIQDVPTVIACHPWELTLPYYFLLVGTRHQLHVSYTSRDTREKVFTYPHEKMEAPPGVPDELLPEESSP